jgi:HEXXH motif-containing protein
MEPTVLRRAPARPGSDALAESYAAFSFPQVGTEVVLDTLVPLIVQEYGRGLTAAYLGRHLGAIDAAGPGLASYLASWLAEPAEAAPVAPDRPTRGWDYAFGDAYRAIAAPGADHARVATGVAAHLGACGLPGSWAVQLSEPIRLRWGDWLLPAADALEVGSDGTAATVSWSGRGGRGVVELAAAGGAWRGEAAEALHRVQGHGVGFTLLTRDALAMRDYEDLLERALPWIDERMLVVFADALALLHRFTPEYLPWIDRTVHQLFLLSPRPSKVESGSVEHYLGLVHLTAHGEPLPVAELLLHEATHQYMNVLAKLQPLDDGTDDRLYWSPAVETDRPVSKIIAAFHAFGNVLLFYRWCRERGLPNAAECDRQEALLGGWMEHLVPPVVDNPAITDTGNALCQPLLEMLGLP